jgi:hypothetical protein
MKKMKVSILALSVLVGGAVFASAAASKLAIASTSEVIVSNNVPLTWVNVDTIPSSPTEPAFLTASNVANRAAFVNTDGGGKITGVLNLERAWFGSAGSNGAPAAAISSFFATVSGKVSASKPGQPTIQLAIKGTGYTVPTTSFFLTNPPAATAGAATLSLQFKSTALPVPNTFSFTNVVGGSNVVTTITNNWSIAGTLTGSFKSGITGIADNKKINEAATLVVGYNSETEIELVIVSLGSKFGVIVPTFDGASGTGSVNKNGFSLNLKGQGGGSSSVQVKGTVGLVPTPFFVSGTTNPISITTVSGFTSIKGKLQGQAIAAGQSTGVRVVDAAD